MSVFPEKFTTTLIASTTIQLFCNSAIVVFKVSQENSQSSQRIMFCLFVALIFSTKFTICHSSIVPSLWVISYFAQGSRMF
jgi:hypothetical protein